jgi:hypothetical protein
MRILIVEDEKKVAKALRDGLEQTFGSEYEAFRAAVPRWITQSRCLYREPHFSRLEIPFGRSLLA